MKNCAIGIDIGGTKIKIGIVNEQGTILSSQTIATAVSKGALYIQHQLIEIIHSLSSSHQIQGVGIGIPGQLDSTGSIVLFAKNLEWQNVPLKTQLEEALALPVLMTNDVRAATLAEWKQGAGKTCKNFICLFIGTGVGGGIVSEGKLLQGTANTAGELGHMIVDNQGPRCTCGNWGCLEAFAGGWAIEQEAQNKRESISLATGKTLDSLTGRFVTMAAQTGDPICKEIIHKAYQALAIASINIVNIFNPSKIIIGGGLAQGMPDLCHYLTRQIHQRALSPAKKMVEVIPAQLGLDAGMIGAAQLFF